MDAKGKNIIELTKKLMNESEDTATLFVNYSALSAVIYSDEAKPRDIAVGMLACVASTLQAVSDKYPKLPGISTIITAKNNAFTLYKQATDEEKEGVIGNDVIANFIGSMAGVVSLALSQAKSPPLLFISGLLKVTELAATYSAPFLDTADDIRQEIAEAEQAKQEIYNSVVDYLDNAAEEAKSEFSTALEGKFSVAESFYNNYIRSELSDGGPFFRDHYSSESFMDGYIAEFNADLDQYVATVKSELESALEGNEFDSWFINPVDSYAKYISKYGVWRDCDFDGRYIDNVISSKISGFLKAPDGELTAQVSDIFINVDFAIHEDSEFASDFRVLYAYLLSARMSETNIEGYVEKFLIYKSKFSSKLNKFGVDYETALLRVSSGEDDIYVGEAEYYPQGSSRGDDILYLTSNTSESYDIISMGEGDDTLIYIRGEVRYGFDRGDGYDVIAKSGNLSSDVYIDFGGDIKRSDLRFVIDGQDLLVRVLNEEGGGGDLIRFDGVLKKPYSNPDGYDIKPVFKALMFSNGDVFSFEDMLSGGVESHGSTSSDYIVSDYIVSEYIASLDNPLKRSMYAGDGDDLIDLRVHAGKGSVAYGEAGDDRLIAYAGSGATLDGGEGNDTFILAERGGQSLYGSVVLNGGQGTDTFYGSSDGEVYQFEIGHGNDLIIEENGGRSDSIVFGAGINLEDLLIYSAGDDLIIETGHDGDSITVRNSYLGTDYQVDRFVFDNGYIISLENLLELTMTQEGSSSDDILSGSKVVDRIYGKAGDDFIDLTNSDGEKDAAFGGSGQDFIMAYGGNGALLSGGDGDDVVIIFDSDNSSGSQSTMIVGGRGDDRISGSQGRDIYKYNRGDGWDTIDDIGSSSQEDKIVFGDGILLSDIAISSEGNDLIVNVLDGDELIVEGGLRIVNAVGDSANKIELFQFQNGVFASIDDISQLQMVEGNYQFEDESDYLAGYNSFDGTYDSGVGEYHLNRGDGHWFVPKVSSDSTNDVRKVVFGGGISFDDIRIEAGNIPESILLKVYDGGNETGDQVEISYSRFDNKYGVETLVFSNDVEVKLAEFLLNPVELYGTNGDDTIYGARDAFNHFYGGAGNDTMQGYSGSDYFYYNRGDGLDRIRDYDFGNKISVDKVIFGEGVSIDDIQLSGGDISGQLVIDILQDGQVSGDRIELDDVLSRGGYEIEELVFADNSVALIETLLRKPFDVYGTDADENLYGTRYQSSNFYGGKGDDYYYGWGESDYYYFNRGDGKDVIDDSYKENGENKADHLIFGDGIDSSDIRLVGSEGTSNIILQVLQDGHVTGDQVTISQVLADSDYLIEELHFADGSILRLADLIEQYIDSQGSATDDTSSNAEPLPDDESNGSPEEVDSVNPYYYARANGRIELSSNSSDSVLNNSLVFGDGINTDDIRITAMSGSADIILQVLNNGQVTDDQIVLLDALIGSNYPFDEIHFSDGYMLTTEELLSRPLEQRGSDSDDSLFGLSGKSSNFHGGQGNDQLYGYEAGDSYHFNRGDGQDRIEDYDGTGNTDRLIFGEGIRAEDLRLTATAGSPDVVLQLMENGQLTVDQLTLSNALSDSSYHIEELYFTDGNMLTMEELLSRPLEQYGSDGDDSLEGMNDYASSFHGGQGNDQLYGYEAGDSYHFNRGDGQDRIEDYDGTGNTDRLIFGEGVSAEDLRLTGTAGSPDVVLQLLENGQPTGDQITLSNALSDSSFHIEELQFADGSMLTMQELLSRPLEQYGSDGDDSLEGLNEHASSFHGGQGNDQLYGYEAADSYHFNRGDGQDRIEDQDWNGNTDRLIFGEGISAEDLRLTGTAGSADVVLQLLENGQPTGDQITLSNALSDSSFHIEELQFADGSMLTMDELLNRPLEQYGSDGDDSLEGLNEHASSFHGGQGNDQLYGYEAGDSYHFNRGDGQDWIEDQDWNGNTDRLIFGEGISAEDLRLTGTAGSPDVVLQLLENGQPTGDQITLSNALSDSSFHIEELQFADGSMLTMQELLSRPLEQYGSDGDDYLEGLNEHASSFHGGQGNDQLYGYEAGDSYHFNRGDGQDWIEDYDGNGNTDRLIFGEGISAEDIRLTGTAGSPDVVLQLLENGQVTGDQITLSNALSDSSYHIEELHFVDGIVLTMAELLDRPLEQYGTDGDDSLYGLNEQASNFHGGQGNDQLYGYEAGDSYYFNRGDGQDWIEDYDGSGNTDRLIFGEGISAEDIRLTSTAGSPDVVLQLLENGQVTGDQITLSNALSDSSYHIEELHFTDGSMLTMVELLSRPLEQYGSDGDDSLEGMNDYASSFHAGQGNDQLYDYQAGDSYHFNRGDGQDWIEDYDGSGNTDRLIFGDGISAEDIRLTGTAGSADVVLQLLENGQPTGDQLTLSNALNDSSYHIEELHFTDGDMLTMEELLSRPLEQYGSDGDDSLEGLNDYASSFHGGQGNDQLYGYEAGDSYHFNRGDGQDWIEDQDWNGNTDRLIFGEGISAEDLRLTGTAGSPDVVLQLLENGQPTGDQITLSNALSDSSYHIEELHLADGSMLTMEELFSRPLEQYGSDGDDYLEGMNDYASSFRGGQGNDQLYGYEAGDSYYFNRGDGQDWIEDYDGNGNADSLIFGEGIGTEDIRLTGTAGSPDVVLQLLENGQPTGDQITLSNALSDSSYHIEELHFADGGMLTMQDLLSRPLEQYGSDGDDYLEGMNDCASSFHGGQGNDQLYGYEAGDSYHFNRGDGQDWIEDYDGNGNTDRLVFGEGIEQDDLQLISPDGQNLVIQLLDDGVLTDDTITIANAASDNSYQIEQIEFASGNVVAFNELNLIG